ncbi:MAG: S1 RNA-binding domain-containing protein [Candidatus Hydrogenedentes bacterium]|jgi:uncharacterized protein|nr:S1 RNA-binding domain-containing protein [Candidatus Hydrogenedentota bacterium]
MIAQNFIENIAHETKTEVEQVAAAIALFNKGATVPFVARYRKDVTRGLNESKLERIFERNDYFVVLTSRRDALMENIEKQGKMTDELRAAFCACEDHLTLEDVNLPFKKIRNNRAAIAANKGLLSLADYIWAQSAVSPPPVLYAESFVAVDKQVLSVEEALEGARDILAECIAMNADIRRELRDRLTTKSLLVVHPVRVDAELSKRYSSFANLKKRLEEISAETLLGLLKAERESALRLELVIDDDQIIEHIAGRFIQDKDSAYAAEIQAAVKDAYKRLLRPVIEDEVLVRERRKAEDYVISNCRDHLRSLLLTPPAGSVPVIGICSWEPKKYCFVIVDGEGTFKQSLVVEVDDDALLSAKIEEGLNSLLESESVAGIGISSGPGGREVLQIVQRLLNKTKRPAFVSLIQDNGLAAYVHSALAVEELPELDDALRATVSIARRLQDPLAELVKVDPCSLIPSRMSTGVNRKSLLAGAVQAIESIVNRVGVNLNTASVNLLRYVSGLQFGVAQVITEKRQELGKFTNRTNLQDISGIGEKTYQQCAAFLRIFDGENPLDASSIHPESYGFVDKMLKELEATLEEVRENPERLRALDLNAFGDETTGPLTLEDICYELGRLGRDARRNYRPPQNFVNIDSMDDLREQMVLEGIITNITDFGIFVNIGLEQEGLVHRSEVGRWMQNDPKRILQVGSVVKVMVLQIEQELKRIGLSIKAALKLPLTRPQARESSAPFERYRRDDRASNRFDRDSGFGDGARGASGAGRRRRDKKDLTVQKTSDAGDRKKKDEKVFLNTTLADQLASLRDKIIANRQD